MNYVQHEDGEYRVNPTYGGMDWAIIIDINDMLLVLYWKTQSTAQGTLRRAARFLRRHKIKAGIVEISYYGKWWFPKYKGLKSAAFIKMILDQPLPSKFSTYVECGAIVTAANGQNIFPSPTGRGRIISEIKKNAV